MSQDLTLTIKGNPSEAVRALRTVTERITGLGPAGRKAGQELKSALTPVSPILEQIGSRAQSLAPTLQHTGRVGSQSLHAIQTAAAGATAALGRIGSVGGGAAVAGLGRIHQQAQALSNTLTGFGLAVGASLAGISVAIGKGGVEMNLAVAGARTALEQLLGSADLAGRAVGMLREEARKSKPTFAEMLGPFTQLVQVFKNVSGAARAPTEALRALRAFGDTAAITANGDVERMNLALLGLRQMMQRPTAQMEEVGQIGENLGVDVYGILKRKFGTSDTADLAKMKVTGAQVGMAIIEGLEQAFGGAQARMARTLPGLASTIMDTLNDLGQRVTEGFGGKLRTAFEGIAGILERFSTSVSGAAFLKQLSEAFGSLGEAIIGAVQKLPAVLSQAVPLISSFVSGAGSLLKVLSELAGSQKLVSGILAPFYALGNALGVVSEHAGGFVKWLEAIINRENVTAILSRIGSLLWTVGDSMLRLVGIDLGKVFDAGAVGGFFKALDLGIDAGIRGFFSLGRVGSELGRMLQSLWQDVGDKIGDVAEDTRVWLTRVFVDGTQGFRKFVAELFDTLRAGFDAIKGFAEKLTGPLRSIGEQIARGLGDATGELGRRISSLLQRANPFKRDPATEARYLQEDAERATRRAARDAGRIAEDPHRRDPWNRRIEDAWTGRGRDRSAERDFFFRLELHRRQIAGLFETPPGITAPTPRGSDMPGRMINPGKFAGGRGSSVTTVPRVQIPAYPSQSFAAAVGQAVTKPLEDATAAVEAMTEQIREQVTDRIQQVGQQLRQRWAGVNLSGAARAELLRRGSLPEPVNGLARMQEWARESMARRWEIEGRYRPFYHNSVPDPDRSDWLPSAVRPPYQDPQPWPSYSFNPHGGGGGQPITINMPIYRTNDLSDPEFRQRLHAEIDRKLDEEERAYWHSTR